MSGFLENLARRAVGVPEALAPQPSRSSQLAEGLGPAAPAVPAEAPARPIAASPASEPPAPVIRGKQAGAPAIPAVARPAPITVQAPAAAVPALGMPAAGVATVVTRPAGPEAVESMPMVPKAPAAAPEARSRATAGETSQILSASPAEAVKEAEPASNGDTSLADAPVEWRAATDIRVADSGRPSAAQFMPAPARVVRPAATAEPAPVFAEAEAGGQPRLEGTASDLEPPASLRLRPGKAPSEEPRPAIQQKARAPRSEPAAAPENRLPAALMPVSRAEKPGVRRPIEIRIGTVEVRVSPPPAPAAAAPAAPDGFENYALVRNYIFGDER